MECFYERKCRYAPAIYGAFYRMLQIASLAGHLGQQLERAKTAPDFEAGVQCDCEGRVVFLECCIFDSDL
jgi:hypothetical protein